MHPKALPWLVLFGLALALQAPAAAHPLLVDDFSEAVGVLTLTSSSNAAVVTAGVDDPLGVLGGRRTTLIATTGQQAPGFDTTTITYVPSGIGFMDANSQVGWSGRVSLSYDLSALPSVLEGALGVRIEFVDYDAPGNDPMPVTVQLDAPGGGPGVEGPAAFAIGGPQSLQVWFPAGDPLDDIDTLEIIFAVPAGGDFRIDAIWTVPEPSTLAMLALGLGLAGVSSRRRARSTRA